jgi:transcriptional regulator GlxA family with amidase domain
LRCVRYGFSNLGRFAAAYARRFGYGPQRTHRNR